MWECKRQPLVTMSTMESEYVAASKCVLAIKFVHKFMKFVNLHRSGPTKVWEDNAACIAITDKPVHRSRSKHIGVKYHNVREASQNGEVELVQIWTEHQVADVFTKALGKGTFLRLRGPLMGYVPVDEMMKNHMKASAKQMRAEGHYTNPRAHAWPKLIIPLTKESEVTSILGYTAEEMEFD